MAYTLTERTNLVLYAVGGISREQAGAIAQMCQDADARGENAAVWHQSAIYFGRPEKCNCVACRPSTPKGAYTFKSL